jgi:tetratricopeptide (TPR) repeat protein
VIASNQRSALAALSAARPTVARLDVARDPEEIAADLLEVWPSVETSLRSLVGGSALSGQALIHEVRQRELLSLEQAHALVEMLAVHERVQHTDYRPMESDVAATHAGYDALQEALSAGHADGPPVSSYTPPTNGGSAPAATEAAVPPQSARRGGRAPRVVAGVLIATVVALVALGIYLYVSRYGVQSALRTGQQAYAAGQRAEARTVFAKVAEGHPDLVLPHLYLARIARDNDDFGTAGTELATAGRLAPNDAAVQRELGAFFLARGQQYLTMGREDLAHTDIDAARNRYVSALQIDANDRSAQGYLGCALVRLGRTDEGMRWLTRAGQGGWSACAPSTANATSPPRP